MALTEQNLKDAIDAYLPETEDELTSLPIKGTAISGGFRMLSRHQPDLEAADATVNPIPEPANWDSGFSDVVEAEWPFLRDTTGFLAKTTKPVHVDEKPTGGVEIRVVGAIASAALPIRYTFTKRWTLTLIASLDVGLEEPLKVICAAIYAQMLAGFFEAQAAPGVVGAQLLDAGAKSDSYRAHSKALMESYRLMLGLTKEDIEGEGE